MAPSALHEHGIHTLSGPRAWVGMAGSTAAIVVAGLGLILAVQRYLHSLDLMAAISPDAAIARAGVSLKILGVVTGILAIGTSLYTIRSCRQVLAHRQLPPPGAWVLGNPTVLQGTRAVVWGRIGYVLAALLAVTAVMMTVLTWQFVDLMMSGVGTLGI
jgi:hypothetical protein